MNGVSTRRIATPAQLRSFGADYAAAYPTADGQLPLTYHALLLVAQA